MSLFWEVNQQRRIGEANKAARKGMSTAQDAARAVEVLETRIDKLTLISMAMWELLCGHYSEDDLIAKIQEIDLRDGAEDGKYRAPTMTCSACSRTVSKRHARCLYCGAEQQGGTGAFD